jgi:hypothetical protein
VRFTFEGRDLTLDFEDVSSRQAIVIQGYTGLTLRPWMDAFQQGDPKAITAVYWLARAQSGDVLAIQDCEDLKVFKFLDAVNTAAVEQAQPEDPQSAGAEAGEQAGISTPASSVPPI